MSKKAEELKSTWKKGFHHFTFCDSSYACDCLKWNMQEKLQITAEIWTADSHPHSPSPPFPLPPRSISHSWRVLMKFCWWTWAYVTRSLSINQTFTKVQRATLWIGDFHLISWMEEAFFIVDIISHNYLICKWEEKKMKGKRSKNCHMKFECET